MSQQYQQQQQPDFLEAAEQDSGSLNKPILGLFELVDRILDKGLVIDAFVSITVLGIPLVVIRARIVVAGLDTFLRYQEAMGLKGEPGEKLEQREQKGLQPQQAPYPFQQPQYQQQYGQQGMAS